MTDRQMLMAAIREHPDEDTPRLAYADCLEERGDPFFSDWAGLIRVQVEFARTERFTPRWLELARQQGELLHRRRKEWTPLWNSRLGPAAYRRGFQEAHQFYPAETFLRSADLLFAGNPLRAVRLLGLKQAGKEAATAIVRHPGMERVETLDVTNNDPTLAAKVPRLLAPRMPRLRALGLGGLHLTAGSAADLLNSLALPGLMALDLSDNPLFQPEGYAGRRPESLFHSPALARLQWLDLARASTAAAVRALAHSPVIRGLRFLNLAAGEPLAYGETPFFSAGAEALAEGPAVRGVEFLNLSGQRIGPHGMAAIARSPLLSTVRELNLAGNDIGDEGAIALAASPNAASLRRLTLTNNGITAAGAEAILASPHLAGLRILNLALADPYAAARNRLRERFPDREPTIPNLHNTTFFEPIP
jgi:uncharacterized protein (TIGR02996 family)